MFKKITNFAILFTLLTFIVVPSFVAVNTSFAQDKDFAAGKSLVPCGTDKSELVTGADGKQTGGEIVNPCTFDDFLKIINKVVNFLLFVLAIPLAAIMFAFTGFKMVTSGGDSGQMSEAKAAFTNVAIGLILAAGAWLIIHTLLSILGFNGNAFGL